MVKAGICTIGDEILIGQIVDTNSSGIAKSLNSIGVKVSDMSSIGDDHKAIVGTLDAELRTNDIVIVTGGLGPTILPRRPWQSFRAAKNMLSMSLNH